MAESHLTTDTPVVSARYRAAVEGDDLNAHVPNWRFQTQGRSAVAQTLRACP
jgi:hypothetical protein